MPENMRNPPAVEASIALNVASTNPQLNNLKCLCATRDEYLALKKVQER